METLSHIYSNKNYVKNQIKLLCTNQWTDAIKQKNLDNGIHSWYIDDIPQASIGAGHNGTCGKCIIEYSKRKMITDNKITWKLIQLAENGVITEKPKTL